LKDGDNHAVTSRSPTDSSAIIQTRLFIAAGKFFGSCNKRLLQAACGRWKVASGKLLVAGVMAVVIPS
jgi:hypothetical protein